MCRRCRQWVFWLDGQARRPLWQGFVQQGFCKAWPMTCLSYMLIVELHMHTHLLPSAWTLDDALWHGKDSVALFQALDCFVGEGRCANVHV